MDCPYDALSLRLAIHRAGKKLEDGIVKEEDFAKEMEPLNVAMKDKATFNASIATENGITVLDLINSPNYQTLVKEHVEGKVRGFIGALRKVGFADDEAWGLMAIATGKIRMDEE